MRAYESDELDLTEGQQAEAVNDLRTTGDPDKDALLKAVRKAETRADFPLEAAYGLELDDYREVEAAWRALPAPPRRMRLAR